MERSADMGESFLTLAEAAERLGVSRLKLREGIAKGVIAARRDNEGRWRVDLQAVPGDIRRAVAAVPADPADLMSALFDEIEELGHDLAQSQEATERLAALAGSQADLIDRMTGLIEARTEERDRLGQIAGRAIAAAEEAEARAARLQATTDRAIGLLDRAAGAIEGLRGDMARLSDEAAEKERVIAGHGAQLDRLFALSEQALDKAAADRRPAGLIARVFGTGAKTGRR
jgi:excisionase family DNA binding protein